MLQFKKQLRELARQKISAMNAEIPQWIAALAAFCAARKHPNPRFAPGIAQYFKMPEPYLFHQGALLMHLLQHYIFCTQSNADSRWRVAISLLSSQIHDHSAHDGFPVVRDNAMLPTAYILHQSISSCSDEVDKYCEKMSISVKQIENNDGSLIHRFQCSPLSSHVLFRVLRTIIDPLQTSNQTFVELPHFAFLGESFYSAFKAEKAQACHGGKSYSIRKNDFLHTIYKWSFNHFIATWDMRSAANTILDTLQLAKISPSSMQAAVQVNDFPRLFPNTMYNAQHYDYHVRYMQYITAYLSIVDHNKASEKTFRSLLPRSIAIFHTNFCPHAARYPQIACRVENGSKTIDSLSERSPPLLGHLLNVFELTIKRYYALSKVYSLNFPIRTVFDWNPMKSVTLTIYRMLLGLYQKEITSTGNSRALPQNSWKLATNFLTNLTLLHGNECTTSVDAKSPVLSTSMYFSLLTTMFANECSSGTNAKIKPIIHRQIVLHMHSMLLQVKGKSQCSTVLEVYRGVKQALPKEEKATCEKAKSAALLFAHIVLQKHRQRSMDLWAKSLYVFSTLESALKEVEFKEELAKDQEMNPKDIILYKMALQNADKFNGRSLFLGEMFRQLCENSIILNTSVQGDQSPRNLFWMNTAFLQTLAYITKSEEFVEIHQLCSGFSRNNSFQRYWLGQRVRFLLGSFPGSAASGPPLWCYALQSLERLCKRTESPDEVENTVIHQTMRLIVLLCVGQLHLASFATNRILQANERWDTFSLKTAASSEPILLQDRFGKSCFYKMQSQRYHYKQSLLMSMHIHTPMIMFFAVTSNIVWIIQELLYAVFALKPRDFQGSQSDHLGFIASREFWNGMLNKERSSRDVLLNILHILLTTQRSLAKGSENTQRIEICRINRWSVEHSRAYYFKFAGSLCQEIASTAGVLLSNTQHIIDHVQKTVCQFTCKEISRDSYLDMYSTQFKHSFILLDTANIVQAANLKIFIQGIAGKSTSVKAPPVTVLISSTFFLEFLLVSQHKAKNLFDTKNNSHRKFYTQILETLKDLMKLSCARVMVLSPEAEYAIRCPMEDIVLGCIEGQFASNILYQCEIDHVLTAMGIGIHRLIERFCGGDINKASEARFYDHSEVLLITEDKQSGSIALGNGLRCAAIHFKSV